MKVSESLKMCRNTKKNRLGIEEENGKKGGRWG